MGKYVVSVCYVIVHHIMICLHYKAYYVNSNLLCAVTHRVLLHDHFIVRAMQHIDFCVVNKYYVLCVLQHNNLVLFTDGLHQKTNVWLKSILI
jgi:hypothetical protein